MHSKILSSFSAGNFIIVLDEHREEEADFFLLAEHVTPEKINFLLKNARGMICVACDKATIQRLKLPLMVRKNGSVHGTNFCVSVDATKGISTGISAPDRARTISLLASKKSKTSDFVMPGHTFPLVAQDEKKRFGHTESAVKLARKVGKNPVVVICEILNEKGERASRKELELLAKKYGYAMTTLEAIRKEL